MTDTADQPFSIDELISLLVEGELLAESVSLSLTEYTPDFLRRPNSRRWHFRVDHEQKHLCHLIVGLKLAMVHDRAKKMTAACPDLTCRPLLFQERKDGMGFLCLEHFQGESLDKLVEQGRCDPGLWRDHVRHAQKILGCTKQISTEDKLVGEVRALIEEACGYPGFSEFDAQFLRGPAQQAILAGALSEPIFSQWSNGDFVGRNLLIDPHGKLRLIDYEYAERTHFSDGDWLRLMEFSVIPSGLTEQSIPELKTARQPWREVRLWVHHLAQLKTAQPSPTVTQHSAETVGRLFGAISRASLSVGTGKPDSLMVKLIADRHDRDVSLIEERTGWAKSLEAELQSTQNNFKKLSAEHSEKSTWADSLQAELLNVQENFEKINREFNDRMTWAKSLEAEHRSTQEHFEKQTREFNERTAWALALEAELQTTRSAHQQQSQTMFKLAAERDRLKAELESLGQLKINLESDLSEVQKASVALAGLIPLEPAKGARAILERSLVTFAELKRDLAIKNAAVDHTAALSLEANLSAGAAESEVLRLNAELNNAQVHIDGLLANSVNLQVRNGLLEESRWATNHKLGQTEQELAYALKKLHSVEAELVSYEQSFLRRMAARAGISPYKPLPPSQ